MKDFFFYEQQVLREVKRIHICGYRCNERLKDKTDGSPSHTLGIFVYYESINRKLNKDLYLIVGVMED